MTKIGLILLLSMLFGASMCPTNTSGGGTNSKTTPGPTQPATFTTASLQIGADFGCFLDKDGTTVCWAHDGVKSAQKDELAQKKFSQLSAAGDVACGYNGDIEKIECWKAGSDFEKIALATDLVKLGENLKDVAVTNAFQCVLREDGVPICFVADQKEEFSPTVALPNEPKKLVIGDVFICGIFGEKSVLDCRYFWFTYHNTIDDVVNEDAQRVVIGEVSEAEATGCVIDSKKEFNCFARINGDPRKDPPFTENTQSDLDVIKYKSFSVGGTFDICGVRSDTNKVECFRESETTPFASMTSDQLAAVQLKSIAIGKGLFCGQREDGTLLCGHPPSGGFEKGIPVGLQK